VGRESFAWLIAGCERAEDLLELIFIYLIKCSQDCLPAVEVLEAAGSHAHAAEQADQLGEVQRLRAMLGDALHEVMDEVDLLIQITSRFLRGQGESARAGMPGIKAVLCSVLVAEGSTTGVSQESIFTSGNTSWR
jgi:hypothetical protein